MSRPIADQELRDIRRRLAMTSGAETSISVRTLDRMVDELFASREAVASVAPTYAAGNTAAAQPTAPPSIEQSTLRDEFAMRALAAVIATPDLMGAQSASLRCVEADAQTAYRYADAMLAERAKEPKQP